MRGWRHQIKHIADRRGDVADHRYVMQKIHDNVSCRIKTVKLHEKWTKLTVFEHSINIGWGEGNRRIGSS